MATFKFSKRSLINLKFVHPDLVRVMTKALEITDIDFGVIHGLRSIVEQKALLAKGATTTIHSRHLKSTKSGYACAVDIACYQHGKITWDSKRYITQANYIMTAANLMSVPIEWGGSWITFKDYGHYQLPWGLY